MTSTGGACNTHVVVVCGFYLPMGIACNTTLVRSILLTFSSIHSCVRIFGRGVNIFLGKCALLSSVHGSMSCGCHGAKSSR